MIRHVQTSLRKNSFYLFLARASAQGLGVLFIAIVARKFGVESFGYFAFITSLVYFGNTFTNFGSDTFLVRETARAGKITEIAAQSLSLQITFSLLYCLVMLAFQDSALLVYCLALFPLALYSVNNGLLRGMGRMDIFSILSFATGIMQIVAALFSKDVATLCLYLLIGHLIIATISFFVCRASLPDFRLFPLNSFSPIFKLTLPFALLAILLYLIQRLGIFSISALLDETATGYFSSISRIVEGLKLGHYAILGALLPVLSRGGDGARQSFRKAFLLLMTTSLSFAFILMFFSPPVIYLLYGSEYLQMSPQLSVLGWSLLPYTISAFISYDFVARGLESIIVKAALISILIYLALYLLLIPIYGVNGAVWSALIGEFFQGMIFIIFYARNTSKKTVKAYFYGQE